MKLCSGIWFFLFTVIVTGCNDGEEEKMKANHPENIFFDYVINAEENGEFITCKFQFLKGGPEGKAIRLEDPASVVLDGELITPDSSRFNGVYYESVKPLKDFKGKHSIVFTSPAGKKYREEFEFTPFSLESELSGSIKRNDLSIRLKNFPLDKTPLRLVMTDTAFGTSWINKTIAVTNAELLITRQMLSRLKNGPIGFELHREKARSVKERTRAGGRIRITYSLKREFELTD